MYLGDGTLILDLCLAADDGEAAAAASHCREMRGRSTAVRRAMFSPVLCSTASEAVNGFEDGWIRSYTVTVSLSSCPPLLPVHFALKRLSFLPPPRPCTTLMFVGKGRGMDLCQNAKIGVLFPQPAEGKF